MSESPKRVQFFYFAPQCACKTRNIVGQDGQPVCAECYTFYKLQTGNIKSITLKAPKPDSD